jgi:hypothetical protein
VAEDKVTGRLKAITVKLVKSAKTKRDEEEAAKLSKHPREVSTVYLFSG